MSDVQKVYENGVQTKEIVTNNGPHGSSVSHVQNVHHGALNTTYKETVAVVTTDKNGDVHIDKR